MSKQEWGQEVEKISLLESAFHKCAANSSKQNPIDFTQLGGSR